MENTNIEGIGNINVVKDLFSQVNCLADNNCFLVVVNRDYGTSSSAGDILTTNATIAGSKAGGVAGGIVGGVVANSFNNAVQQAVSEFHSKLNDKQKIVFNNSYCGFLVNIVPNGIGIIPLRNDGQMLPKVKDFKTDLDNYVYFSNDEIEKKQIENLPLNFSSKKLAIYFKDLGNVSTPWTLPKKHKLVSYQQDNFNKIVELLK